MKALAYLLLVAISAVMLFPFFYMFTTSLKDEVRWPNRGFCPPESGIGRTSESPGRASLSPAICSTAAQWRPPRCF
jgi:ABC-type glycerol-3-phosphate transport system permease component